MNFKATTTPNHVLMFFFPPMDRIEWGIHIAQAQAFLVWRTKVIELVFIFYYKYKLTNDLDDDDEEDTDADDEEDDADDDARKIFSFVCADQ